MADERSSKGHDEQTASNQELVKATFYITQDQVIALEELRLAQRRQGLKTDKSELVRQAIDLLVAQAKSN